VVFQFICDKNKISEADKYPFIEFKGEIIQEDKLELIYKNAHAMIIASENEGGLPLSGMEAMANGLALISTDVGDVSLHIKNYRNGFISSSCPPEAVLTEMMKYIKELVENRELIKAISIEAYEYAKNNFSKVDFCHSYRNLFGY
jgi:glycosyltransferase involved in cell wall biosynthesis